MGLELCANLCPLAEREEAEDDVEVSNICCYHRGLCRSCAKAWMECFHTCGDLQGTVANPCQYSGTIKSGSYRLTSPSQQGLAAQILAPCGTPGGKPQPHQRRELSTRRPESSTSRERAAKNADSS